MPIFYDFELIIGEVSQTDYEFSIESEDSLDFTIDNDITCTVKSPYEGPYSVIPLQVQQILETSNKNLDQNIVVEAIPSNYGLITWNGSVLTVS